MSVCPRCGAKVASPSKVWPLIPKDGVDLGESQIFMGAFHCPACKNSYNAQMPAKANGSRTANVKNKIERIMRIQGALMQTVKTLKEKIAALEAEKSSLMAEIETLRKTAEARVVTLEAEVSQMREEAKSLQELITKSEPAVLTPTQSPTVPS